MLQRSKLIAISHKYDGTSAGFVRQFLQGLAKMQGMQYER